MCTVLAGLQIATTVAQGAMGFMGQSAQAEAQEDAYKANLENAKRSTFERYDAINKRVIQERAAASQQLQEAQIEGLQARGSARVAAQESGVSGISVSNVINNMYRKNARYERNTQVNFDYTRDALIAENQASRAAGQNQVNSMSHGVKPSPFAAVLNIFGQSLDIVSKEASKAPVPAS